MRAQYSILPDSGRFMTIRAPLERYWEAMATGNIAAIDREADAVALATYEKVYACAYAAASPGGVIINRDDQTDIAADARAVKGRRCINRFLTGLVPPDKADGYACQAGKNHVKDVLRRRQGDPYPVEDDEQASNSAESQHGESSADDELMLEEVAHVLTEELETIAAESDIWARRVRILLASALEPISDAQLAEREGIAVSLVHQDRRRCRERLADDTSMDRMYAASPIAAAYIEEWLERMDWLVQKRKDQLEREGLAAIAEEEQT